MPNTQPQPNEYEAQLARALRRVHPALRTALLHHVRGQPEMTGRLLDEFLRLQPISRSGDGYLNAESIAQLIMWEQ